MCKFRKFFAILLCMVLTLTLMPNHAARAAGYRVLADNLVEYMVYSDYAEVISYRGSSYQVSVQSSVNGKPVTGLDYGAFHACTTLTRVTLPDTVTKIGKTAFEGCTDLRSVNIPYGVTTIPYNAFFRCSSLTSITIPTTVETISMHAFSRCESLASIVIPDSVKTIGDNAFEDCTALAQITLSDNLDSIGSWVFNNTAYFNDESNWDDHGLYIGRNLISVKDVSGSYAVRPGTLLLADRTFQHCPDMTEVHIPGSVRKIGFCAFKDCTNLVNATIADGVTCIDKGAFSGCSKLAAISIPDSVTSLGAWAFESCGSLASVDIGGGVTSIGKRTFENCRKLTAITIPDNVTTIEESAFRLCTSLSCLDLGGGVKSIEDSAFSSCNICDLNIPDNVVTIGNGVFSGCSGSINIGKGLTSMGTDAFTGKLTEINADVENMTFASLDGVLFSKDMTKMLQYPKGCRRTSYVIPDGVKVIGTKMFFGCNDIIEITIPASVERIEDWAFSEYFSPDFVYYGGSKEQWADISVGTGNNAFKNASIHYNCDAPVPEITKISASSMGDIIIVSISTWNMPDSAMLMAAGYNAEGRCVTIGRVSDGRALISGRNVSTVKVFAWGSLNDMIPLCPAAVTEVYEY